MLKKFINQKSKSELSECLSKPLQGMHIILDDFKQKILHIKAKSENSKICLYQAQIKKLIIEQDCNLSIDLRDNSYIDKIVIKDNFIGSINLSRNSATDITIGDNCRCDLIMSKSVKCFNLSIGNLFSGRINVADSCFHKMSIGNYCYANIYLKDNWGKKTLEIGDSFLGNLIMNNILIPDIKIGENCRGYVSIAGEDSLSGIKDLEISDNFDGKIDVSDSQSVRAVNVGENSSGLLNFSSCPSLKVLKFDKYFKGEAQLSKSSVEYISALEGCEGKFILFDCKNLSLLSLPSKQKHQLDMNTKPLKIEQGGKHIFYYFQEKQLPSDYFKLRHHWWLKKTKKYVKNHLSRPKL